MLIMLYKMTPTFVLRVSVDYFEKLDIANGGGVGRGEEGGGEDPTEEGSTPRETQVHVCVAVTVSRVLCQQREGR